MTTVSVFFCFVKQESVVTCRDFVVIFYEIFLLQILSVYFNLICLLEVKSVNVNYILSYPSELNYATKVGNK